MGTDAATKTAAQFTPGPWEHVAILGGPDGVVNGTGMLLCRLVFNERANATLMASAPDLLAALKGLLAWVNDPEARATTSAPFDAAQRAIAAAEGSAP